MRIKWYSLLHRDSHSGRPPLVCPEWRVYECFAADVGPLPDSLAVLCMKDPELGFCRGNVFWGSQKERLSHRRNQRQFEVGEEKLNLSQWADRIGVHRITLSERLRRHDVSTAITTPKLSRGGSRIVKTCRRRRPKIHIGLFERETSDRSNPDIAGIMRLLQESNGDLTPVRNLIADTFGETAAQRAIEVLMSDAIEY